MTRLGTTDPTVGRGIAPTTRPGIRDIATRDGLAKGPPNVTSYAMMGQPGAPCNSEHKTYNDLARTHKTRLSYPRCCEPSFFKVYVLRKEPPWFPKKWDPMGAREPRSGQWGNSMGAYISHLGRGARRRQRRGGQR